MVCPLLSWNVMLWLPDASCFRYLPVTFSRFALHADACVYRVAPSWNQRCQDPSRSVKIRQDPSRSVNFFSFFFFPLNILTWVPKAHAIDEHEIAAHHDPCFSTWLPASSDANAGGSFVGLTGWKWQKRTASPWKARCIQMGADVGSPLTLELLHASIWIRKHPKM